MGPVALPSNCIVVAAVGRSFFHALTLLEVLPLDMQMDGDISSPHRIVACMHHRVVVVTPHERMMAGARKVLRPSCL